MKAVLALTASVAVANAALVSRQGIADIPQCALSCALGSLGSTGCGQTDFACICKASAFIEGLVPCVKGACSPADYEKTLTAAQGLCQQAGVSLSVPAGAAATSAAGSSSAAASSAAATTSAPSTEATGVTSASSEPTSAATSAASSAVTSAAVTSAATQSSAAATTTGAPTKASGSNSTVSSTSPPKPSGTEPSAAHRNTIALGGLGAIIALVAAFL
ncbi:hypothetical protein TWF694_004260 [Orbilia ellipsospora]|uniref:CFEM domain-containing protein n=1 Tax=Orbilia ellipsospora TaxID=2528407 RepID=A0AAV9WYK1_9PEZI